MPDYAGNHIRIVQPLVALYPYDSLAEAYEANGERESAIRHYKRSLELNPSNANAVEHLKKLGTGTNK